MAAVDLRVPGPLQEPLAAWAAAVRERLDPEAGIYLHGSIALEAFSSRTSDIDFVVVLGREHFHAAIRGIHRDARRASPWGSRLEGIYLPDGRYVSRGHVRGRTGLSAVTRSILRERGVVLAGRDPRDVFDPVTREDLDAEMRRNLSVYWAGRARRPWSFLFDEGVDFAVTTLARIRHTLATGEIVSKPRALALLPARWQALADDVESRARGGRTTMGRWSRARETLELIHDSGLP